MIMLIAICITILVRSILGKNIHSLLEEVNDNIELADSLWIVTKGGEQSVMTSDLETIFPFTKASHFVDRDISQPSCRTTPSSSTRCVASSSTLTADM